MKLLSKKFIKTYFISNRISNIYNLQKINICFRAFITFFTLLSLCSCSSQKPAPHIDKSHLVFSKDGQKHIDESTGTNTLKVRETTVFESAPADSDIVQTPLQPVPDKQQTVTKTLSSEENKISSYDVNKLTDIDLEKQVDHRSDEPVNRELDPPISTSNSYKIKSPLNSVKFDWPVEGKILSHYGKNGNKFNEGINVSAPLGAPVVAASDGKVVYIGNNVEGYGNLLILRHSGDLMTAYAHLKEIVVERGASVKRGESVGSIGQVGNVTQPQLHFSIRKGKKTVDPELALD